MPIRTFTPLTDERRTHVPTSDAAHHLSRAEQTLRKWACDGSGPIQPIRVAGRLAWPVGALRNLLGVSA